MSDRLTEPDWREIVKNGEPWDDPYFSHGKHALFMNHKDPHKKHKDSKQRWVNGFTWKRASEYFGEDGFKIFDGVDPSDAIMGSCNNCYAFAAISGIAEAHNDEKELTKDE